MTINQASKIIDSQIKSTKSQTFVIEGSYKSGQKSLAKHIIELQNEATSSDLVWITKDQDKSNIGLGEVDIIKNNIKHSPLYGKYSFSVIEDADFLTKEAQNSLLKIIEEPSKHSIIFLLGTYHNLLPTIYSRCTAVHIDPLEPNDILLGHQDLRLELNDNPNLIQDIEYLWSSYLELLMGSEVDIFKYSEEVSKKNIELLLFVWESIHWVLSLAHTDKPMYTNIRLQQNLRQLLDNIIDVTSMQWNYRVLSSLNKLKPTILFSNRKNILAIEQFLLSNYPNI